MDRNASSADASASPDADDVDFRPGDVVGGKYALVRKVGAGGMGIVWSARQIDIALPVAIKILNPHLRGSAIDERLRREAQIAAQVQHPHLVRAFDLGTAEGGHSYIVLEWSPGRTLGELLDEQTSMSPANLLRMFLPIVSGVVALHRHGVVHRDIKPDNILIARDGEGRTVPKLLDFGIAKTDAADGVYVPESEEHGIVGTPGYLAPEQVTSDRITDRTDVWSLCVTMVEALTGVAVIDGDGIRPVVRLTIDGKDPSVRDRFPEIPASLAQLLEQGLRIDPTKRIACSELLTGLARCAQAMELTEDVGGRSIGSYLPPNERRRRRTETDLSMARPASVGGAASDRTPEIALPRGRAESAGSADPIVVVEDEPRFSEPTGPITSIPGVRRRARGWGLGLVAAMMAFGVAVSVHAETRSQVTSFVNAQAAALSGLGQSVPHADADAVADATTDATHTETSTKTSTATGTATNTGTSTGTDTGTETATAGLEPNTDPAALPEASPDATSTATDTPSGTATSTATATKADTTVAVPQAPKPTIVWERNPDGSYSPASGGAQLTP